MTIIKQYSVFEDTLLDTWRFYFFLKGGPGQSFRVEERLPDFPDVEADQVHPLWLQHKRRRLYDVLGKNYRARGGI